MTVSENFKHKYSIRGIDTMQAVYAFVMALGLREVFIGSHTFINDILFGSSEELSGVRLLSFLLLINITLLGMRFFWVPRNLRSYVCVAALAHDAEFKLGHVSNIFISMNWLIIFFHAGLYFVICLEFKYIMFIISSDAVFDTTALSGYILGHAFLLIINGLWIGMLARSERAHARADQVSAGPQKPAGGVIWFRNNLAFSLLAIGPFALIGTCQSAAISCIAASDQALQAPGMLLPTSPVVMTVFYDLATMAFGPLLESFELTVAYWVLFCFFLNSLLDLATTGRHYLVLEEIEWEDPPVGEGR